VWGCVLLEQPPCRDRGPCFEALARSRARARTVRSRARTSSRAPGGSDFDDPSVRKPDIMGDATRVIFNRPSREATTNFYIDDDVLPSARNPDLLRRSEVDPRLLRLADHGGTMRRLAIGAIFVMGVAVGALAEGGGDKLTADSAAAHDKWRKSAAGTLGLMKDHFALTATWRQHLEADVSAAKQPTDAQKVQAKLLLAQAAQDDYYAAYNQSLVDEATALSADMAAIAKLALDGAKHVGDMEAIKIKNTADKQTQNTEKAESQEMVSAMNEQAKEAKSQSDLLKAFATNTQAAATRFKKKADSLRAQAKKLDPSAK
jgi:hypothetical protein